MNRHTVKQLAKLSGVSVRTLHYYDEIGLLKPAEIGANGYRYYGRQELLRLQQILLHRELGLPLDSIAALLDTSDRNRIDRLQEYREQLAQRISRHHALIATVDRTIASLRGENTMDESNLYKGFSTAKQAEYEEWIVNRFSSGESSQKATRENIAHSRRHIAGFSKDDMAARSQRLAELEAALAGHCRKGTPAGDAALAPLLDGHREWVAGMWGKPCPPGAYAGLADLYESHPDFRARYETVAPGFADYLPTAMRAYSRSFSISAEPS
jgi:MerR family transcriptional regulator, thiopeptide resistance regulator